MPYSELIKNFEHIREYMREFYVFGFRSRGEYTHKSARSYDDERRRIESWLGESMRFRQTEGGKNVFLSIDSRSERHNPLYAAWKAKSFTDTDISLHFILFDLLHSPGVSLTLNEILEEISRFGDLGMLDESTVRKKLKEYVSEGLIVSEKDGRVNRYRRAEDTFVCDPDVLDFFSETAPLGVIGSFLLDREETGEGHFSFKHHYITGALDSGILLSLFEAMSEKRSVTLTTVNRKKEKTSGTEAVPLRIFVSVQSGREYLMAYVPRFRRITSFRLDNIVSVKPGEVSERFGELREKLDGMLPNIWGVSTNGPSGERMEHVEFTVRFSDREKHIPERLEREKRCGTVTYPDENTAVFTADVYDAEELVPWIRTFICRITDIVFSDKKTEERFRLDLEEMYEMYLPAGEEGKA